MISIFAPIGIYDTAVAQFFPVSYGSYRREIIINRNEGENMMKRAGHPILLLMLLQIDDFERMPQSQLIGTRQ